MKRKNLLQRIAEDVIKKAGGKKTRKRNPSRIKGKTFSFTRTVKKERKHRKK